MPESAAPKLIGSLNHVRFSVSDIAKAEAFYRPLLGFMGYRLTERSDTRLEFAAPGFAGRLQWVILTRVSGEGARRRHDRYSPGLHHFAWNADSRAEVDALYALLQKIGATILDPPAEYDYSPGYYAVFFADPDGLKLELVHVPRAAGEARWRAILAGAAPAA